MTVGGIISPAVSHPWGNDWERVQGGLREVGDVLYLALGAGYMGVFTVKIMEQYIMCILY